MSRDKNLLMDVWLVSLMAGRLVANVVRGSAVSVDEFALYGLIADLGPVTPATLAQWTGLPRTSLSAIIKRCELRGELERAPNPSDRRSYLVRLSSHGFEVYLALVEPFFAALEELRESLAGREAEMRRALQHLDGALRSVLAVPERPYGVEDEPSDSIAYGGEPLTPAQTREVLSFVEWLRHRDREGPRTTAGG